MGKLYDEITPELADWLGRQKLFIVATAPLAADGLVNCSPKGMDTFRIIGPREVAYLDLTGSGVETIAHLGENGRIVFMFMALDGPPGIVRLHGRGEVLPKDTAEFAALARRFPDLPGARAVIRARLVRISDSCGFAVPRFEFVAERDTLTRWAETRGPNDLQAYRRRKNTRSLDGLPGIAPDS